jgi:hypothetical protein
MPPLWRPGIDEATKVKVVASKRLLPIAPRAGIYLTTPSPRPCVTGPFRNENCHDTQERFAAIFRKTWFRLPRRARMRLRRYWRDESWPYHDSAYSPRIALLGHWPSRPKYRWGAYAGESAAGLDRAGHHLVFWVGAIEIMPRWHVATTITGMLAHALYFCQKFVDSRTHGFPPPPRNDLERVHANPAGRMAVKWGRRWNEHDDDVEAIERWFYRNQPKLRCLDLAFRRWAFLIPADREIVVCR